MAADQVNRLVEAALRKDPAERAAYLEGLSEFDPDLREEVETLLAAEEGATVEKSTAIRHLSPDSKSPDRIGPYHILREIGEGGMGVVYEAEQEKPVRRKVALKLIKWGMDTKAVVARFESERQALALMNHPNIASVFDAGATPEGRPYFAMEVVHGEPITEYCDKNRLTIRERLGLFIQVCEGVQHAHQKGIIHRDIKPSNVLITVQNDKQLPKIIDFGVAKATSQSLTERTVYTELGQLIGTPEYMSPEQAEMTGIDIDTRTDVYSLGVVLYELLVGTQPFDVKTLRQANFDDMRRKIREEEPPKPSTRLGHSGKPSSELAKNRRTELRILTKELSGDLDWIVMRALEKDRTRRYGSPSDLAADIVRHLKHEAILASPPSTLYRAGKFVRRHKLGVAVAAGFVALLIGFAVLMSVQSARIARERDRANREAEVSKEVSAFLTSLFEVSDPAEARGGTMTAKEILERGASRISELEEAEAVKSQLMVTIGRVYTNLGLFQEAAEILEEAVKLRRDVAGSRETETLEALHELANTYWFQGRDEEAEPLYREILSAREETIGETHPETLRVQMDLASLMLRHENRHDEAVALSLDTLDQMREILGDDHEYTLTVVNNLANIYYRQDRYEEALPLFQEAHRGFAEMLGPDHPFVLVGLNNIGTIYLAMARYDEAESTLRSAREALLSVLGEEHPHTINTTLHLAELYRERSQYPEAESLLLTAYAALLSTGGEPRRIGSLPDVREDLVELYEAWGKPEKAAEYRALLEEAQQ